MKKRIFLAFSLLLVLGFLTIYSCKKSSDDVADDQGLQTAQDNARAEDAVADAFGAANNAGNMGGTKMLLNCPSISVSGTWAAGNRTATIDYGTAGCAGLAGVLRKGKITVSWAGTSVWNVTAGSKLTITFDNYYAKGVTHSGTMEITYNGPETYKTYVGAKKFTIVSNQTKYKDATGKEVSWTANRTLYWVEGITTPLDRSDDIYLISGLTTGTNANGKAFKITTTDVKINNAKCTFPIAGTTEIVENNDETKKTTVEYGGGTENCGAMKITRGIFTVTFDLSKL